MVNGESSYEELYEEELKKMPNHQIVSLLVMNIRNQEKRVKKYGMTKKSVEHVEKLVIHIQLLQQELLERMDKT